MRKFVEAISLIGDILRCVVAAICLAVGVAMIWLILLITDGLSEANEMVRSLVNKIGIEEEACAT